MGFYQNAETRDSNDTLTSSYETTRRHIPEDGSPHIRRIGNLKIHITTIIVMRSLLMSLFIFFQLFPILVTLRFPFFSSVLSSSLSVSHFLSSPAFLFFFGSLIFFLVLRHVPFSNFSSVIFNSSLVFFFYMLLFFLLHGFNPHAVFEQNVT